MKTNDRRKSLLRMGVASMRFTSFFARSSTMTYPIPHMLLDMSVNPTSPGIRKVDVARARLGYALVGDGRRIDAPLGTLQEVVHEEPRQPPFGPSVVVPVGSRGTGHHDQNHLAHTQVVARRGDVLDGDPHVIRRERPAYGLGAFSSGDSHDTHRLGGTVAKGDAEGDREHDRKTEGPEDRARLAEKEAEADERQLGERGARLSHGALAR